MSDTDPYADDPFFKAIHDADWNACLGRQGEEENYLDGYIEAAIELADAIIEKRLFGKRDTLVLPILYNARHAIELTLKFATDRLVAAEVVRGDGRKRHHNIKVYWKRLQGGVIGDKKLSRTINALGPYVDSLGRIDSNGQQLRYHTHGDNDPSLANYTLANLRLIQVSLHTLQELIIDLRDRTVSFLDERATGSYTKYCSRMDLLAIAQLMPPRDLWKNEVFARQKAVVMERFGLGKRQFALALDRILESREMRAFLGMESGLLYLTDDEVIRVVKFWRRIHPIRQGRKDELGLNYFHLGEFQEMAAEMATLNEIVRGIEAELSPEAIADLETVFYLGRDQVFAEYYEAMVARNRKEHAVAQNHSEKIRHLMQKTNFLLCVQLATTKLGCLSLADRLKNI